MMRADLVRLRRTTPADIDWVVAAEAHADNRPYVTQWTRAQHAETLDDHDMSHWIVESLPEGRSVGYVILAGLAGAPSGVELRRIVITDKGRGYGRATLRQVRTMALRELGARRLWLDVRPNNPKAKRLYEQEGFVVEGTGVDGLIILAMRREDAS